MKAWIEKTSIFFNETLWNSPLAEKKGLSHFFFKWTRVIYLVVRGFLDKNPGLHAASLTFYTMMSVVPLLALFLAITAGFGFHENIRQELLTHFAEHEELISTFLGFSQKMIENVKGGVVAGYGFLILFLAVTQLFRSIESAFNQIWEVKRPRFWKRVMIDYFSILFLGPILYLVSSSLTVLITTQMELFVKTYLQDQVLVKSSIFFIHLIHYTLFACLFTFLYFFMPNLKVKLKSAALAGFLTGIAYVLVQKVYIYFQVGIGKYSAIYGSFAALPLFLVWVQTSWLIILLGAEFGRAHQFSREYEFHPRCLHAGHQLKEEVSLWLMTQIVKSFLKEEPFTLEKALELHPGISLRFIKKMVHQLVNLHLVIETKDKGLIPTVSPEGLKVADVLERLDGDLAEFEGSSQIAGTLKSLRAERARSSYNKLLRDLP